MRAMSIVAVNAHHEPQIRRLLDRGRRVYENFGREDLQFLLDEQLAYLAQDRGHAWGVALAQGEERPVTLPPTAPDRVYLRALALEAGHAPDQAIPLLIAPIRHTLGQRTHPSLFIVNGGDRWLTDALPAAGFTLTERVQFFRLAPLTPHSSPHPHPSSTVQLSPLQPSDLNRVAQLDAEAFDPLWHFGPKALWELLFTCRLQVALENERLVGYTAVALNGHTAYLVRIAVHPTMQGHGIGRLLLHDAIDYARSNRATELSLNTQISNERSQRLYRSFGFEPTRQSVTVFTQVVPA
jgi:[ribosomal protein S18]-alanine N-acetyltransferase